MIKLEDIIDWALFCLHEAIEPQHKAEHIELIHDMMMVANEAIERRRASK